MEDNRFNRTDDNPINARSLPTLNVGVETIAATYLKSQRVSTWSASRFAGLFRGICVTFAFRAFPPTREEKEIGGKEGRKEGKNAVDNDFFAFFSPRFPLRESVAMFSSLISTLLVQLIRRFSDLSYLRCLIAPDSVPLVSNRTLKENLKTESRRAVFDVYKSRIQSFDLS